MNAVQTQPNVVVKDHIATAQQVVIYNHSQLFYWWPVWVAGYALALITYFEGEQVPFNQAVVYIHPSKNLGVIFTIVCLLVIVMTNVVVRGVASLTVMVSVLAVTFLFAYMGWWDRIFRAFDSLAIYMNLGFYVFFATSIFLVWASAFFVFDRMNYWVFKPGQAIHHAVMGGGEQSYDSVGMSVFKLRDDLFRHWILGLGSGDLHIATAGAKPDEFVVPNVLFIGGKLTRIQELLAMKPDEFVDRVETVGHPG